MRYAFVALFGLLSCLFALGASAGDRHARDIRRLQSADRDCKPLNGRYGYYGNPWCDTGSYRPPDLEIRARERRDRKLR